MPGHVQGHALSEVLHQIVRNHYETFRAQAAARRDGHGLPRCAGRMRLVALIRDPAVVARILRHLHLPVAVPVMRPTREPRLPPVIDVDLV